MLSYISSHMVPMTTPEGKINIRLLPVEGCGDLEV